MIKSWSGKRELSGHLMLLTLVFITIIFTKQIFAPREVIFFVLGGILGTFLPDLDHLIYALYLKPHELTSKRIAQKIKEKNIREVFYLLYISKKERLTLTFHTMWFQALFLAFSFLVITSSRSIFGVGLVFSFLLHLLFDEYLDLKLFNSIGRWFYMTTIAAEQKTFKLYFYLQVGAFILLAFLL